MKPKIEDVTTITLKGNNVLFTLEGSTTIFPGFEALYKDEEAENLKAAPNVSLGDSLKIKSKDFEKKFTTPPANYTEAKLVKIMEEVGIGRPSTYASTIAILQKRKYVTDTAGVLQITDQGRTTAEALDDYFPDIINTEYTALMESQLDKIASGEQKSIDTLNDFYGPFIKDFEIAQEKLEKKGHKITGEKCPVCGSDLVYKDGKNGIFVGCSNFPKCRYIKKEEKPVQELKYTGENCPDCGKPLIIRKDKKGREFVGCSGFPKCHYIKLEQKEDKKPLKENEIMGLCPKCGGNLIKKKGKYSYFIGCTNFPKCNYMEKIKRKK
jgi:DNA topoisomerase-1